MALDALSKDLLASLEKAKLVPGSASNLIPDGFKPSVQLNVTYDERQVQLGNLFRVSEVTVAPRITFDGEDGAPPSARYMLLLVDPDAPTPQDPKFAFWRHWIQSGLQPLNSTDHLVAQGRPALTEYLGPGPKDDSEPHRYLFLLYREPDGFDIPKEDVGGEEFVERRSFDAAGFAKNCNLRLVGVNWMLGAGDGWKPQA